MEAHIFLEKLLKKKHSIIIKHSNYDFIQIIKH